MQRTFFQRAYDVVAKIGAKPNEDDDARIRRILYVGASLVSVLSLVLYPTLFFWFGAPLAGWAMLVYLAITLLCLFRFALTRRRLAGYVTIVLVALLAAGLSVQIVLGGLIGSAVHVVWGLLSPLGALVIFGPRKATRWFAAYVSVIAVGVFVSYAVAQPPNRLDPVALSALMGLNLLGVSAFAFGILYYFVQQRDLAFRLLRGERERSEGLLLNILPKDIAAILKNETRTIADHFDGASVLFADVVDFTPLSARLTPTELVGLLNEVFSYFDSLVEKYGVEKIKTIGDCYMVASGVPRTRPDHAEALTRLALEMRDFVEQHEFGGHKLAFRVGINSGPVVAGVIGRKKFIYDLWGDAVNTASRMESQGSGGIIQITRATYELIKDGFDCQPRGEVDVKGKGAMEVWHVLGER